MRGILARLGRLLAEDSPTPADVRSVLDIAYQQHLRTLAAVRRADARLGALSRRLEIHLAHLEDLSTRLGKISTDRSDGAAGSGPHDDLRALVDRHAGLLADQTALRAASRRLGEDERRISAAADAFRVQRAAILGVAETSAGAARARRLVAESAAALGAIEAALDDDLVLADRVAAGLAQAGDVALPRPGPEPDRMRFEQPPGPDAPRFPGSDLR